MSSEIIRGEINIFWDSALVNNEYFVLKDDFWWAENWDEVEIIDISENPNIKKYKVVWLINETRQLVKNTLEWFIRLDKKWNWYLSITWEKNQIFINKANLLWAKTWDKVSIILWNLWWKEQWIVQEILKVSEIFNTVELVEIEKKLFLKLDSSWRLYDLNNFELTEDYRVWDIFKVKILWEDIFIEEKLWSSEDYWIEILKIAASNWLRLEFSTEVLDEVNNIESNIESEIEKREDLRNLFTITIDWPDSKDLDDAISVEFLSDWTKKLYVHIADVTHFVKENSHLDKEALLRWNSYYYADRVTPMYPERLSNDLCSLNPHTDKLTLTAEIFFDKDNKVVLEKSKFYESIIKTDFRMTYEEIDKIKFWVLKKWNKLMFWNKVSKELINLTNNSFNLSEKISNIFKQNWELEINSTETKIIVDDKKNPVWIKAYPSYESNNLIKNFMVIANNVIPQLVEKEINKLWFDGLPFVFRTHGKPDEKAIGNLQNILKIADIEYNFQNFKPKDFALLLEHIKWHPKEQFLSKRITRTLQKAIYSHLKEWHFGLALEYYSHFTSPIRRYSDTQIHRIIKEILAWEFTQERYEHYMKILAEVAEKCSIQEDVAEINEAWVNNYLATQLMKEKIWEKFNWYIDDISTKQVKIELDNTVSWYLEPEEFIKYHPQKLADWIYEMVNNETWKIISLWEKLQFEIIGIDEVENKIFFKII